ncbi:MAG: YafY family transcriptional regulator [Saprospiraceae bacterium]|nr:YafY family transcriptional regulator [Saprospiraceae bacterium]
MNRIDRLSAMLTQLQAKRRITARTLADRFDISLRTVYRDIRALEESGVPIIGEAGIGYSIMEGYRLPPVMFTREEAFSLLVAEKIAQTLTDQHNTDQIHSAMFKIRSILRTSEKKLLEEVDENIAIRPPRNSLHKMNPPDMLQKILNSIAAQKVLHIHYSTIRKEEVSERDIEPIGIYFANDHWYLIAHCHLRQGYRTFRTDRVQSIHSTDRDFQQRHPSLLKYLASLQKKQRLIKVVLHINASIAKYIKEEKYQQGFVLQNEKDDVVEMIFMVSSIYGISRWIMKMAEHAQVIEPDHLKNHVVEMAQKILDRYENS